MVLEKEAMHNARYGVSVLQGKQLSECEIQQNEILHLVDTVTLCCLYATLTTTIPGAVIKFDLCSHPEPARILGRAHVGIAICLLKCYCKAFNSRPFKISEARLLSWPLIFGSSPSTNAVSAPINREPIVIQ